MSVYTGITLAMAKRFEERVQGGGGGLNVRIQQNKLQVGIKETKWEGGAVDEHHLSGPVRLRRTPVIN